METHGFPHHSRKIWELFCFAVRSRLAQLCNIEFVQRPFQLESIL